MRTTYDYEQVKDVAETVVLVYPDRTNGECRLALDDYETPVCVVGEVLDRLGLLRKFASWDGGAGSTEIAFKHPLYEAYFTPTARAFLNTLQMHADRYGNGDVRWDEALRRTLADTRDVE